MGNWTVWVLNWVIVSEFKVISFYVLNKFFIWLWRSISCMRSIDSHILSIQWGLLSCTIFNARWKIFIVNFLSWLKILIFFLISNLIICSYEISICKSVVSYLKIGLLGLQLWALLLLSIIAILFIRILKYFSWLRTPYSWVISKSKVSSFRFQCIFHSLFRCYKVTWLSRLSLLFDENVCHFDLWIYL